MTSRTFTKSWGAEYTEANAVRFRLWASGHSRVMLRLSGEDKEMNAVGDGWFELTVPGVAPGAEYQYVLPDGMAVPDPASRAQKADVNGPSLVVDPSHYAWQNTDWQGR